MNKYEVLGTVGEGAYGIVLKCQNRETSAVVAIKKFKESDEDELVKKTMMREVKVLTTLRDLPGIVTLLEAFRRRGKLYLVFEYVGRNLLEVLEDHPRGLGSELVRRYSYMLLEAIDSCHALHILHRDIKPENILINSEHKTLKLCDFGFARSFGEGGHYTDYVATRWYRCPELLLGVTRYNEKVDVWAVGCIVSEMAEGHALFPGESELDQLNLIQKLLGTLGEHQRELFRHNPRFSSHSLPRVPRPDTLEKRHSHRLPRQGLNLMKSLLCLSPFKRISSKEGLKHGWFEGLGGKLKGDNTVTTTTTTTTVTTTTTTRTVKKDEDQREGRFDSLAMLPSQEEAAEPPAPSAPPAAAVPTESGNGGAEGAACDAVGYTASHALGVPILPSKGKFVKKKIPQDIYRGQPKHVECGISKRDTILLESPDDEDELLSRELIRNGFERQCSVNYGQGGGGGGVTLSAGIRKSPPIARSSRTLGAPYALTRRIGKQLPRLRDSPSGPPHGKVVPNNAGNGVMRSASVGVDHMTRPSSGSAITIADISTRPYSGRTLSMLSRPHVSRYKRK